MPGMEAAISTLRERVDGPDVLAASRAAQNALIGSPMVFHKTSAFRVIIFCTTPAKFFLGVFSGSFQSFLINIWLCLLGNARLLLLIVLLVPHARR